MPIYSSGRVVCMFVRSTEYGVSSIPETLVVLRSHLPYGREDVIVVAVVCMKYEVLLRASTLGAGEGF